MRRELHRALVEAEVVVLREEAVKRLSRKTETAAREWSKPIAKKDLRAMLGPM